MEDGTDDPNSNSPTVPLLLNPAYARSKSCAFDELRHFRISLKWCALDHSSPACKALSYLAFLFFTFLIPAATSLSLSSSISFNQLFQLPESGLAAISFFTLAVFFRRHGLRKFLLLDGLRHDSACVRRGYARELDRAFRYLAYILLPAFSVELAHKTLFFTTAVPAALPRHVRALAFAATLASWVYRTGLFMLVCVLFRLTCELQILRFEGFYKMFEEDVVGSHGAPAGDALIFREHGRIRRQLLVTSHRYRIFILGCMVTITISQLGALVLLLASKIHNNFCNSGDLVVCSIVQLSGFLMCLIGAARITHRAQRVVSIASRWHMAMSCASNYTKSNTPTVENQTPPPVIMSDLDESDPASESKFSDGFLMPPTSQGASTFESRQALVIYLQHNGGGITLFGFALDRGLLHTLFAFEMSLVLWILSKLVVLS